jgi:biopolymer transport protein TolR
MQGTKKRRPISEINVIPYIDVMLVLLVIFMITAPLLSEGINVNLPEAATKVLTHQAEPIIVSVDANGEYYLNTLKNPAQAISLSEIANEVQNQLELSKQHNQIRDVFVKGDSAVDYGRIVKLMAVLQRAGAASIGLMTIPPSQ